MRFLFAVLRISCIHIGLCVGVLFAAAPKVNKIPLYQDTVKGFKEHIPISETLQQEDATALSDKPTDTPVKKLRTGFRSERGALTSPGDTPLLMRHNPFPTIDTARTEHKNTDTTQADTTPVRNASSDTASHQNITDTAAHLRIATPEHALVHQLTKTHFNFELYLLCALYFVWFLLKLIFPNYHCRLLTFTQQCLFFNLSRRSSMRQYFQIEHIFFRLFSLAIYTYIIWIYFLFHPFFQLLYFNHSFLFIKIFLLLSLWYLLRLGLIIFWQNKTLNNTQLFFHTTYVTGISFYLLIYVSVLSLLNTSSAFYDLLHGLLPYIIIYLFLNKGILILKTYNQHFNGNGLIPLLHILCFEFTLPVTLFFLTIQDII